MGWAIASIPFWISGGAIVAAVLYAGWKDIRDGASADEMLGTALGCAVLLMCGGGVMLLAAKIAS